MRICLIHPGASFATADVHDGLTPALERAGHTVDVYRLDGRMELWSAFTRSLWQRRMKARGMARPTIADVLYLASQEVVTHALRTLPDWVIVLSGMYLHPDVLIMLQRAGIRTALLLTESPYDDAQQATLLPYVAGAWTNERSSVSYLSAFCENVGYLPHAFDPARHHPTTAGAPAVPAHDVVFVGTGFQERIEVLSAVAWTGIDLGLYGTWGLLRRNSPLRRFVRGGVTDNRTTAALYRAARIGLNLYRTSRGYGLGAPRIAHAESLNPRALELAADGCFQISDRRAEVDEVFGGSGGSLVPTFRMPAELADLVRFYLFDPQGIAAREDTVRMLPASVAHRTFDAMARRITADLTRWESPPADPRRVLGYYLSSARRTDDLAALLVADGLPKTFGVWSRRVQAAMERAALRQPVALAAVGGG